MKVEWKRPRKAKARARVDFVARQQNRKPTSPSSQAQRETARGAFRDRAAQSARETVSGRWLVRAMLATVVAAGVALYLTICLLFYQGQWQFTFSPPKIAANASQSAVASLAASSGLTIQDVQFDYTEEGVAQLDGWWIPAPDAGQTPAAQASAQTVVLLCHNGHTALPQNLNLLRALHGLGVSVFAFDYRGFGASQHIHPSQQKAYADGIAALDYLTGTRHLSADHIVVYGAELGSAVAAHAAQQSPQLAGLVLEDAQPSLVAQVKREQHLHLLPLWLVFQDRFDISRIVPALRMPKLFLVTANPFHPGYDAASTLSLYRAAAPPKQMLAADSMQAPLYAQPQWKQAMQDFLKRALNRAD